MRITAKLIFCISIVQFAVGCSASLPEQCRQLKTAKELLNDSYYKSEKETDKDKKTALLTESFSQKAKTVESIQISDSNLKAVQTRIVKYNNDFAKWSLDGSFSKASVKELKDLVQESKNIDNDLKAICSN
ncbi:hypothetical protein [Pseudanabaena sp. Chao 1811]|uniref:hypothetical protein n=1 Tax=Pseudanabaena sp. Chao 1811 TaxID=2963092 RepID=UPI0022F3C706|nr:hypothetical protein [Pseudanabaena sp. Chao 1811]